MPKTMEMREARNGWTRIPKQKARKFHDAGLPVYAVPADLTGVLGDPGILRPIRINPKPGVQFEMAVASAVTDWLRLGHPGQLAWLLDTGGSLTLHIEFADGSNPWVFYGDPDDCRRKLDQWKKTYELLPRPSGTDRMLLFRAEEKHENKKPALF